MLYNAFYLFLAMGNNEVPETIKNLAKIHFKDFFERPGEITDETIRVIVDQYQPLSETAPGIIILFNHKRMDYEYITESIQSILGYSREEFLKGGFKFGTSLIQEDHKKVYNRNFIPVMFKYYGKYFLKQKIKDLRFTYTFKIKKADGSYMWALHVMSVIKSNIINYPLVSVVYITDITEIKKDNILELIVSAKDESNIYNTLEKHYVDITSNNHLILSRRELEIVKKITIGNTASEIAQELGLSVYTINNHRKNILVKCKVNNTAELVTMAHKKGWV